MPEIVDAGNGSVTLLHKTEEDKYVIQNLHDDSGARGLVKAANEAGMSGHGHDGMRLERIIPQHVLDRSFAEGWFNDKAAWKRWANSPEGRIYGVEYNGKVRDL